MSHRGEEKVSRFSIVGGYFSWYDFLIGFTFYRKLASAFMTKCFTRRNSCWFIFLRELCACSAFLLLPDDSNRHLIFQTVSKLLCFSPSFRGLQKLIKSGLHAISIETLKYKYYSLGFKIISEIKKEIKFYILRLIFSLTNIFLMFSWKNKRFGDA